MSVVANKFIALSILAVSCVVLDSGAIAQTATPVQPAAAQGQPVAPMSPREQQAREAMAGGYQRAKYRAARKEREMIEAGKEPLSVLIHTTRDHVTRLAQRLKMAGATDSRLFEGLVAALPALQVEAGKATIN